MSKGISGGRLGWGFKRSTAPKIDFIISKIDFKILVDTNNIMFNFNS